MSYPIVLTHLNERRCIVIGGGQVAERKLTALIEAGAHPLVISPQVTPEIERMRAEDSLSIISRVYQTGDLSGAWLVIAATDDRETNEAIAAECAQTGILLNVVDVPDLCSFTVPAVIRRGDLSVAISTEGQAPAFARYMRRTLEATVDEAYGQMLAILSELRAARSDAGCRAARQADVWEQLLGGDLIDCLRREGMEPARKLAEGMVESSPSIR